MRISIVGLGKLGAPMAAVMAHKGHTIVGVDINQAFVDAINQGKAPVNEPQLSDMIAANKERLSATTDFVAAIANTDSTHIIVPTPSKADGRFSMDYVLTAAEKIGEGLKRKNGWHVVVLASTVMPGCTEGELLPALEKHSGKKCGVDFGLCYNPEFIALGSVVRDLLNPDMILIGESDTKSGAMLGAFYEGLCDSKPAIRRMTFVNAELTKLSVNTYVTTKISYANMLAQVCETLPGADVDVVTAAIGCDSRIGQKYLKGALGYGGPCFPRDNKAFAALARENDVPALLAEATDAMNSRQVPRVAQWALARVPKGGTVGLLGLSYKPHTEVIEESQGVAIAAEMLKAGARVAVYDPEAMNNARPKLQGATFATSVQDLAGQADVLVVTTPWPQFRSLAAADLKRGAARPVILDCWRALDGASLDAEYHTLGKGE